jgi:hypothetical protein
LSVCFEDQGELAGLLPPLDPVALGVGVAVTDELLVRDPPQRRRVLSISQVALIDLRALLHVDDVELGGEDLGRVVQPGDDDDGLLAGLGIGEAVLLVDGVELDAVARDADLLSKVTMADWVIVERNFRTIAVREPGYFWAIIQSLLREVKLLPVPEGP